jgi:hypothetical protein
MAWLEILVAEFSRALSHCHGWEFQTATSQDRRHPNWQISCPPVFLTDCISINRNRSRAERSLSDGIHSLTTVWEILQNKFTARDATLCTANTTFCHRVRLGGEDFGPCSAKMKLRSFGEWQKLIGGVSPMCNCGRLSELNAAVILALSSLFDVPYD